MGQTDVVIRQQLDHRCLDDLERALGRYRLGFDDRGSRDLRGLEGRDAAAAGDRDDRGQDGGTTEQGVEISQNETPLHAALRRQCIAVWLIGSPAVDLAKNR
ncbi:hypothetical protein D3C87_1779520 [compost metagenome]